MIALKVEKHGDGLAVVLTDEVHALLDAQPGDVFMLSVDSPDSASLSKPPSLDDRFERGRAFLERYRPTFDALAK
jgi:hypothetical protein